ncbi:MFS transporter [Clostridium tetani]|uniref:Transporter, MFS superfamily n=2 Tax=Clostridium tetani TaxID=1513 RepID=Q895U4_CLOTE|nr:MFS transporter [Clostridium tetani]AAO35746.1 transporter, MFS superfamily [Clostridium tetani E88]WFN63004.1 MFS transporter [Clostridium tetani]SJZ89611.1 Sugar phosphate permease [Clostridium tetani]SUY55213.1 major facilitator transporter [Clostridium tetani]SUY66237.1 major facilitator transporter [Clostridium tetani]
MSKKQERMKWIKLIVLILGGGTIFKLSSLKDAFYVPMQEFLNLTHTQIGAAMSVYGMVQTIGNFASIYIADRFSKKKLIPLSLIGVGLIGLYLATFPSYYEILIIWGLFSLFAEVIYWPVLLKAVRLLGNEDEQGRMFGFLEAGRGVVDTIVAFSALGIFALLGKGALALRGSIIFYSIVPIVVGIISYFMLEDDAIKDVDEQGNKISKNKAAFNGVVKAIKTPEIWIVSLTIFSIYSVYCGLTYFIPFLKDIYAMPVTLVGAYGIINQYGLKMVGGPVGGILVDKKFKSATKYLRGALLISALAMTGFILLPHESMNIYVGMALTLGFGAIIFSMRAVFFAPIEEIKVPREISGAAMSIACVLGYSPSMFAYAIYGSMLDRAPGLQGYKHVFMTMIAFSILGFVISTILLKIIKKKNMVLEQGK